MATYRLHFKCPACPGTHPIYDIRYEADSAQIPAGTQVDDNDVSCPATGKIVKQRQSALVSIEEPAAN